MEPYEMSVLLKAMDDVFFTMRYPDAHSNIALQNEKASILDAFFRFLLGRASTSRRRVIRREWVSERKRLSIVFTKRYPTKQGVFRDEFISAKENDYATGEGLSNPTKRKT